jgi:hypothetical protein
MYGKEIIKHIYLPSRPVSREFLFLRNEGKIYYIMSVTVAIDEAAGRVVYVCSVIPSETTRLTEDYLDLLDNISLN